ncbi:MAG: hypothetical protein AABX30_00405 [Nanoarchaeota archaeon]
MEQGEQEYFERNYILFPDKLIKIQKYVKRGRRFEIENTPIYVVNGVVFIITKDFKDEEVRGDESKLTLISDNEALINALELSLELNQKINYAA